MPVLQHQQAVGVDRAGFHDLLGRAFSAREGDEQAVVEQGRSVHVAAAVGQREEDAIELAAVECVAGGLAGFLAQEELEVRPLLAKARELTAHIAELPEFTFIGHSHLCKAFAMGNGEVNDVVAQTFCVRKGYKYIISVGSVGQPRDRDPRSAPEAC